MNLATTVRYALAASLALAAAACSADKPQALGTLEYDRVTLPAPAAERIVAIDVHEGQRVEAGARLLTLERARVQAQTQATQAQAQRQREVLAELLAGPRDEDIEQARASLAEAQARQRDARAYRDRLAPLGRRHLVAAADVDRARAAAGSADAQVRAAQAVLAALEHGTRQEQLAQGEASVRAADAQAAAQQVTLDDLDILAPRAGRIDSLPYEIGDRAPVGAPLAILLVGEAPHARIYVLQPQRVNVKLGDRVSVFVDGRGQAYPGRIRMLRSEPVFTPYYALIGKDAARLSYLAEVELGEEAKDLPAGLPVRVEFAAGERRE